MMRNIAIDLKKRSGDYQEEVKKTAINKIGWEYICILCGKKYFIPFDKIDVGKGRIRYHNCQNKYKYCPNCGEIITAWDGVSVCMDDCIIGTEFNRVK